MNDDFEPSLPGEDAPPLTKMSKEDWWDVNRHLKPEITREEFEADYAEMQEYVERMTRLDG